MQIPNNRAGEATGKPTRTICAHGAPIAALAIALTGCAGGGPGQAERPRADLRQQARAVFGADAVPANAADLAWRIALGVVPAPDRAEPGPLIRRLERSTGLQGIEVGTRKGEPILVYGRYPSPETPEAQRDLDRVRSVEADGARPFRGAFFLPPEFDAASSGRKAAWDLRNARDLHGPDAIYTLQIGMYARGDNQPTTPEELLEFRRLAERAVEQLRAEGDPAFFYHGPNGSMVTIGLYGEADHDPATNPPLESPRLRDARERYPNALLNGLGVKAKGRTNDGRVVERLQSSFLVAVPR